MLTLREKDGKNIWLYGGGRFMAHFIKADIIGIIQIILGKGLPLLLDKNPTLTLKLMKSITQ
ncbi:MAG: dihydrofolate reductase [Candidatus Paceibacteria bacterium]|jgi:dihydrofolate reductase